MSASRRPTLHPTFFKAKDIFVANVDFPTPPLALEIAIVNLVPIIGFFTKVFALGFSIIASLSPLIITMF